MLTFETDINTLLENINERYGFENVRCAFEELMVANKKLSEKMETLI